MFWKRPLSIGLLWQFVVSSFVVVTVMGIALGWMLGRIVEQHALQDAAAEARDTLSRRVIDQLSPEDLRVPMTGERYDAFQRFVQESVVSGRTARIKIWSGDGTVVFSDDASTVGQRFPIGHELADALRGDLAMGVSALSNAEHLSERQYSRLLEVYVPVLFPDSPDILGAFEVYQLYTPVERFIAESQRSLYAALAAGLLFMYGAMVAVVKRGHDTIFRQQKRLRSLNRIATELSRCRSSSEVLSTGLSLALEANGLAMGAIWLAGPGGRIEVAARHGFEKEEDEHLAEVPGKCTAMGQVFSAGQTVLTDGGQTWTLCAGAGGHSLAPRMIVATPLLSRGSVLGALGLYVCGQEPSTKADIHLAQAIGAELGVTLENARRYEEARYQADSDPVTGLLNHRAFHRYLDQEFKRARRERLELSLIMMDLDGFKLFNDTYGHPAGDVLLREVTALLSRTMRVGDILARYGGDEFVVLLPVTGAEAAKTLAERFRHTVSEHAFVPPDGMAVPVKLSIGVATYPLDARHVQELLGFADANLYRSKQSGGNVVTGCRRSDMEDGAGSTGSFGVLDALVTAVDNKDHYTRKHSEDVTIYAVAIAQAMGLSGESQRTLRMAGLLHDVGKIGVPDRILRKPGRLDEDEFSVIKQHATLGEMIIKDVPNVVELATAVGSHHEWYDGSGYPNGRKGAEIPLLGRILAVADVYSAMTTDRPYKKALGPGEARSELLRSAGSQLDPQVVQHFLDALPNDELDMAGESMAEVTSGPRITVQHIR